MPYLGAGFGRFFFFFYYFFYFKARSATMTFFLSHLLAKKNLLP